MNDPESDMEWEGAPEYYEDVDDWELLEEEEALCADPESSDGGET